MRDVVYVVTKRGFEEQTILLVTANQDLFKEWLKFIICYCNKDPQCRSYSDYCLTVYGNGVSCIHMDYISEGFRVYGLKGTESTKVFKVKGECRFVPLSEIPDLSRVIDAMKIFDEYFTEEYDEEQAKEDPYYHHYSVENGFRIEDYRCHPSDVEIFLGLVNAEKYNDIVYKILKDVDDSLRDRHKIL